METVQKGIHYDAIFTQILASTVVLHPVRIHFPPRRRLTNDGTERHAASFRQFRKHSCFHLGAVSTSIRDAVSVLTQWQKVAVAGPGAYSSYGGDISIDDNRIVISVR
jgi:hypothetical protein